MSDTPRTEAMIDSCGDYEKAYHYNGRFANFTRALKRQLAEAHAEIERMRPVVEAALTKDFSKVVSAVHDYEAREKPGTKKRPRSWRGCGKRPRHYRTRCPDTSTGVAAPIQMTDRQES
jgi:hypothetical protein